MEVDTETHHTKASRYTFVHWTCLACLSARTIGLPKTSRYSYKVKYYDQCTQRKVLQILWFSCVIGCDQNFVKLFFSFSQLAFSFKTFIPFERIIHPNYLPKIKFVMFMMMNFTVLPDTPVLIIAYKRLHHNLWLLQQFKKGVRRQYFSLYPGFSLPGFPDVNKYPLVPEEEEPTSTIAYRD